MKLFQFVNDSAVGNELSYFILGKEVSRRSISKLLHWNEPKILSASGRSKSSNRSNQMSLSDALDVDLDRDMP